MQVFKSCKSFPIKNEYKVVKTSIQIIYLNVTGGGGIGGGVSSTGGSVYFVQIVDVIKLFGGNLDFPKINKLNMVCSNI